MLLDARPPDDPEEWLRRAEGNLARARARSAVPGAYLEDLCFDAQQAAEKAIKAVLIRHGVRFPYVHDLARLLSLAERAGVSVPAGVKEAEELTRFAVQARYPGFDEPVTEAEYREALVFPEDVVRWAHEVFRRRT